jgi:8-oxo-dGTP diphosphatase
MRTVAAALITRDSKVLVCQRRRDDSHALKWEFPGGKVEPGESPVQALVRELLEELGVDATVGNECFRTKYRYSSFQDEFQLIFYRADVEPTVPLQNLVFERFEWSEPSRLPQYDFLQADQELIKLLASGSIRLD